MLNISVIGDFIVTCASIHSRNRKAGYLIGKGYEVDYENKIKNKEDN